jgi:FkbM family methyltransferase
VTSAPIPRAPTAIAKLVAALVKWLPARVVALVKWELQPTGRLDYPRADLRMALGSPWQIYRLRSCAKEPETVAWLEREFQPDDCLYDIGANVGAYALVAFAVSRGRGTILAFEPGFSTYAELCRNVGLNRAERSIVPLPIALGAVNGLSTLGYSDTAPGAARHSWGDAKPETPATLDLRSPTWRLDDLVETLKLPAPTLIKLDVDGPELEILLGATRTLSNPRLRSCLVELDALLESSKQAQELLVSAGFTERSRHARGGSHTLFNVIFSKA